MGAAETTGPAEDSSSIPTRERVADLLGSGHTVTEIARRLNLSKPTICHHARQLGHPPSAKFNRRYDWAEVQLFYDAGHTVRDCRAHFGFANQTWNNAVTRGDVVARARAIPMDKLLFAGRVATSRYSLKLRLLATGLKSARCEECGLEEWRGRALSLALHHLNGDRHDNRLINLQLLCPNCHSQTENYAGRNRGRAAA